MSVRGTKRTCALTDLTSAFDPSGLSPLLSPQRARTAAAGPLSGATQLLLVSDDFARGACNTASRDLYVRYWHAKLDADSKESPCLRARPLQRFSAVECP